MKKHTINSKAIILGGGTAGWLTAIFIKRNWPTVDVSVIENPKQPPIIAGESGTTTFVSLLRHLKIDVEDFIRKVNATPKLGGKFRNWDSVGSEFIHSLQTDYAPWLDGWNEYVDENTEVNYSLTAVRGMLGHQSDPYLKTLIGNNVPIADALFATYFIKENKVPFGASSDIPCIPMWHFESRGAAGYFKNLGLERGINLIEGEYQSSNLDDRGNITSLVLDGDRLVQGDWFFDCSGFARLLVGKVYNEKLVDYTNYFPARAVVAWWDDPCYCVTTNATAMKYGWSWNINLRHRSGNGYIYDPDHITLDQALDEAKEMFGQHIEPIANFQFTPGMFRKAWHKNTVAIGLSSGFLEPLEANGVAVIIESLYALQDYWKPFEKSMREEAIERFNDRVWYITEDIRDFLSLHYRGHRSDTKFWLSHKNDDFRVPPSLKEKLENWKLFFANMGSDPECHGYSPTAWLMVLQGLKMFDHSPIAASMKNFLPIGNSVLNKNVARYKGLVAPFWTIDEWIQRTA